MVRLYVNGAEAGVKSVPESSKLVAEFDTAYARGVLRAVAFKDGKQIGEFSLRTLSSGAPAPQR